MGQALSGLGYAKTTDLGGYAKTTDLGGYVKTTDLGGYVKTTDLGGYAKTADGYAKTTDLDGYIKIANGAPYKTNEAGDSILMTKSGKGILRYNDAGVNVDNGILVVNNRNILSDIDSKANITALNTLTNTVNTKANQTDFANLTNTVNTKANQADFTNLTTTVNLKADKTSIIDYNNMVDFTLGVNAKDRGDTKNSRALVKDSGGKLNINYANDFYGGVFINATSGGLNVSGQTTITKLPGYNEAALRINGVVPANDENLYSISYGPAADITGTGVIPNTRKQFTNTTGDILATHIQENREFSIYSNGWNPLFSVQGGTGNAKVKGDLTVKGRNVLSDIDTKANQVYVNQLVTSNTLTDLNGKTMWCADGELCKIPVGKRGLDWGYGSSKIIDDGQLKIQSDDNIYLETKNKSKYINMDESGDLILGPGQKLCNNDKSVCLDIGEIVNTKQNFGLESVNKSSKSQNSKLTTWGDVPGWRSGWDVSDGNWSQLKFTKL